MRRPLRALLVLAAVVVSSTALVSLIGAAAGMSLGALYRLVRLLAPTIALACALGLVVEPALRRVRLRVRLTLLALLAAGVSAATLVTLGTLMVVRLDDIPETCALAAGSTVAGVTAALALARRTGVALDRLGETVAQIGEGDLDVRVGPIEAGPELDRLAGAVDAMAGRLEEAVASERKSEVARRDLFSAVSHDLRTPLSAVRAIVEAIDDGVVDDRLSLERYVGELRRSVDVLVELVDDLFELTQLEAAAFAADRSASSVGEVVAAALRTTGVQARDRSVAIRVDVDGVVDTACSPRLARVLHNLLQNAIRYAPSGSTVSLEGARNGDQLELAVVDAGEGIAPDDARRVFEPFFRSDPARHGSGAGLGLALVARIVSDLGGEVALVTAPGEGARFTVAVPAGP